MEQLIQNLNYIIAFMCGLIALHILNSKPADRWPSLFLGCGFLVLAVQALLMNFIAVSGRENIAGIAMPCLALMIGPLSFLCFDRAANPNNHQNWKQALHFFPSVSVLLMLLFKKVLINIDYMIVSSFFLYAALLSMMVCRGDSQFSHFSSFRRSVFAWLISVATVLLLALLSEILIINEVRSGQSLSTSPVLLVVSLIKLLSLAFVVYAALRNPLFFDWLISFGSKIAPKHSGSNEHREMELVAEKFAQLVEHEQLFSEEQASLKTISKQLDVSARFLSESINCVFNQSYSKYMNVQRVNEAKRLLNESEMTITQLMYDAGFRTKSNFNKEFRALEGISPTKYRDLVKEKQARD